MEKINRFLILIILILCALLSACTNSKKEPVEPVDVSKIVENQDLVLKEFKDLTLNWNSDTVKVEDSESGAIIISGANEDVSKARFTIEGEFDFDDALIQRIMVFGLGQKDYVTKLDIYLDDEDEPKASITLNQQSEDNIWDQEIKNVNAIVTDLKITGKHKVSFSVCQYLPTGEKVNNNESKTLLKSIQFVAGTCPLINIRIDESKGTIDAMNSDTKHETQCTGELDIIVTPGFTAGYSDSYTGGTYEMEFIRGRGNSTWMEGYRLPYKIKLADNADLFGMGANKHWAILANALDLELIRNAFTYKIGEELGLSYNPQYVSVDVVMNGEYLGSYILCETMRVGDERIDIDDLDDEEDPDNITGGYLLGAGTWGADEDAYTFMTEHGLSFNVNSPSDIDSKKYDEEMAYIESYIQRIEYAIYSEPNPDTGEVEDPFDLMDLDSTVAYYWIQELSANGDFLGTGSSYCYKLRDGKLYWGPLWDFDIAWTINSLNEPKWENRIDWFQVLLSDDRFVEATKKYYVETLYPLLEKMTSDDGFVNVYYENNKYSSINNYVIWGIQNEEFDHDFETSKVRSIFEKRHQEFVEGLRNRFKWCLDNLDSLKTEKIKFIFMIGDEVYDVRIGFAGSWMKMFPLQPEIEGKDFIQWYFYYTESDGTITKSNLSSFLPIPENVGEIIDGQLTVIVYSEFE